MPARSRPSPATATAIATAAARRPVDLFAMLFAAFGVAVVLATATAGPASAHDRLVSADPADGATLDAPPAELALTFSAEVLAAGAQVAVTTPAGTESAQVAVDGEVLTADLPPDLPGGDWTVAWRVVSSDGHPIEGELAYTVATAEASSPDPSASPAATGSPSAEATASEPTASEAPSSGHQHGTPGAELDEQGEANWTMSWLFGVAVLAAVGVAAAVVLRRRREQHAAGGLDGDHDAEQGGDGPRDDDGQGPADTR